MYMALSEEIGSARGRAGYIKKSRIGCVRRGEKRSVNSRQVREFSRPTLAEIKHDPEGELFGENF